MSVKSPGLGAGGLASLANYATGTFVPTVVGSSSAGVGTYTNQEGFYTIIGNRIFYQLRVTWSATTGTGNLRIGGLPFPSNASASTSPQTIYFNGTDAGESYMAQISANASFASIFNHIGSTGTAALAIPASGDLMLAGSYIL